MKWKVEYEPKVAKELKMDFARGWITKEDITVMKVWTQEIQEHGPEYIQASRLWGDHALEKEWTGFRSSCFSLRGRIIYKIENSKVLITVVRLTGIHDYRKGART